MTAVATFVACFFWMSHAISQAAWQDMSDKGAMHGAYAVLQLMLTPIAVPQTV